MRTGLLTSGIAFLYIVSAVGKSVADGEETPASSMNLQHYNTMLNSMGLDDPIPEKRAYTYVSEYKRLPVYNFGIGKRVDGDNKRGREYSFGLGKRARQYSFGLGKRNDNSDYPIRPNVDYSQLDNLAALYSAENLDDYREEKRGRQPYSFGLGKRAVHFAGGQSLDSVKRPNDLSQRYHFGLGKRLSDEEEDSLQ